jgi:hypothetical protein
MMISITHAWHAARISITSMERHIQNARSANFRDCVNIAVSIKIFSVDMYIVIAISQISIESVASNIIIAYDEIIGHLRNFLSEVKSIAIFHIVLFPYAQN